MRQNKTSQLSSFWDRAYQTDISFFGKEHFSLVSGRKVPGNRKKVKCDDVKMTMIILISVA